MFRDGIAGYGTYMKQLMGNGGIPLWEKPKIIPSDDPMLGIKKKRFFEAPRTDPRLSNTRSSDYLHEDYSQYDNMDDYSNNGSYGTTKNIMEYIDKKIDKSTNRVNGINGINGVNGVNGINGFTGSMEDTSVDKSYIRTESQINSMNDKFNFVYILLIILLVINIIVIVVALPVVIARYLDRP